MPMEQRLEENSEVFPDPDGLMLAAPFHHIKSIILKPILRIRFISKAARVTLLRYKEYLYGYLVIGTEYDLENRYENNPLTSDEETGL
jgi:hypothetical protein